jgi:hypothetical protein
MSDDETAALVERLAAIEARYAGVGAWQDAAARLRARLAESGAAEPVAEFRLTVSDAWAQHLFGALCRRYGLRPFRYRGQRRTTVMVQAPRSFVEQVLWPEFEALQDELRRYVYAATQRVIHAAIWADSSEPMETDGPSASG